jgi:hypothetical protein
MSERRYDDDEVAEILARATQAPTGAEGPAPGSAVSRDGLTLSDLEEIGAEVGIPPARIAEAAYGLDHRVEAPAPQTFLGAPRSVSRIVPIAGPLDDAQWDRLVAEVRGTFRATGKVTVHGALRSWTNGNLQVHVEPGDDGWRVRMRTLKGNAMPVVSAGGFFALFGALILVLSMVGGVAAREVVLGLAFIAGGIGQLAYVRASLPRWAGERAEQMDRIAARIPHLLDP